MGKFKATRIKLDNITFDLDKPVNNKVFYETTRRMKKDKAVERLINGGFITVEKEFKRQKAKEDAVIKALKKLGGVFIP